jgi:hypothetical protein
MKFGDLMAAEIERNRLAGESDEEALERLKRDPSSPVLTFSRFTESTEQER